MAVSPQPMPPLIPDRSQAKTLSEGLSPKVTAGTVGGAVATLVWVLLAHYVMKDLSKEAVTALTGATGTLVAFAVGYLVKDPLRHAYD